MLNVHGLNFHCVDWTQSFKVAQIIGHERKWWIHFEQRFIGSFDTDWIQMFNDMARVHMATRHMSPKSPFLNTPQGLILYLIHLIMDSNQCRQLCVISTQISSRHESPCSLVWLDFFPFPCSPTFFAFVLQFPNCRFVWNLLCSILYFIVNVFSMNKK